MGKIKSRLIRRIANDLVEEGIEFTTDFERNKKIIGDTMPSKKIRNQVAGLLVRIKQEEIKKQKMLAVK